MDDDFLCCELCEVPFGLRDDPGHGEDWVKSTNWTRYLRVITQHDCWVKRYPALKNGMSRRTLVSGIGDVRLAAGIADIYVRVPMETDRRLDADTDPVEARDMETLDVSLAEEYLLLHENCWKILNRALNHYNDTDQYGDVELGVIYDFFTTSQGTGQWSDGHDSAVQQLEEDLNNLWANGPYSSNQCHAHDFLDSDEIQEFMTKLPMASGGARRWRTISLLPARDVILTNENSGLNRIPPNVLEHIMSFLPTLGDVSNLREALRAAAHHDPSQSFWKSRILSDYPALWEVWENKHVGAVDWRKIYKQLMGSAKQQEGSSIYLPDCPAWQNRLRVWENAIHAAKTCWEAELNLRKTRNLDLDMLRLSGCTSMADIGRYDQGNEVNEANGEGLECLQGLEKYIRTVSPDPTDGWLVHREDFQQWYLGSIPKDGTRGWEAVRDVVQTVRIFFGGISELVEKGIYPIIALEFVFRTERGSLTTKSWSLGCKLEAKRCEEIHLVPEHKWIEGWVLNIDKNCSNVWGGDLSSYQRRTHPDWKPEDTKCDAITGLKVIFGNGEMSAAIGSWSGAKQLLKPLKGRVAVGITGRFLGANACGLYRFGIIEADLDKMGPFEHEWIDIFAEPRQVMVWEPEVPPQSITFGIPTKTEELQKSPWCQLVDQVLMDKPLNRIREYTFNPQDPVMEVCTRIGGRGLEYIQFTTRSGHTTFLNDPVPDSLHSRIVSENTISRFRLCADSGERLAGFRILYVYGHRDFPNVGPIDAWPGDLVFWTNKGRRSPRMSRWKNEHSFSPEEYWLRYTEKDFYPCEGQELAGICFGGVFGVSAMMKPAAPGTVVFVPSALWIKFLDDLFYDCEGMYWATTPPSHHLCSGPLIEPTIKGTHGGCSDEGCSCAAFLPQEKTRSIQRSRGSDVPDCTCGHPQRSHPPLNRVQNEALLMAWLDLKPQQRKLARIYTSAECGFALPWKYYGKVMIHMVFEFDDNTTERSPQFAAEQSRADVSWKVPQDMRTLAVQIHIAEDKSPLGFTFIHPLGLHPPSPLFGQMGTHYVETKVVKGVCRGLKFLVDSAVRNEVWTAVIIGVGLLAEDEEEVSRGPTADMICTTEVYPLGEPASRCWSTFAQYCVTGNSLDSVPLGIDL